jgi:hypothetical protein
MQILPQPPQFVAFVIVSTQTPEQVVWPAMGHVHIPPAHA